MAKVSDEQFSAFAGGSGGRSPAAAIWLFAVAALILAMVVVGGATRVTGSGLSITQWQPVSGIVPPMNHGAWERVFALYQATPQYRLLNHEMSLGQFQSIFWWEWAHRLLGRLLGLVFFVPFVALLVLRRLPRRLIGRCALLFVLGALQGVVGWWMVRSGLEDRTSVAPERLATHLGLALALFVAVIWTALEARRGAARSGAVSRRWRWASGLFLAAVFIQCLMGALVAGNHAGLVDADWPLMAGRVFPGDFWQGGLWATLVHGAAAVQFNHRIWAYGLLAAGVGLAVAGWSGRRRGLTLAIATLLLVQATIGVAMLWLTVPLPLALLHQSIAAGLLALATVLAWQYRRA
ncbi:MAG TPA: COX15/CtaA family protein [Caulobacteraceae bacterium]|nr:COX15/CtaA family protein [Caulobacteraceae bacterium]